ncbi:hypothetical protein R3P38DRAFT_2804539 [Favolaschia claudopus]|uniref:Uncharacterized protein n=1 Tax=Favolaschia claudopus TaxID=2862362 RepID=A0AAV9ZQS2_9AGAR
MQHSSTNSPRAHDDDEPHHVDIAFDNSTIPNHDNPVTSGGYFDPLVTMSGYVDASVTMGGYVGNSVTSTGLPNNSFPPNGYLVPQDPNAYPSNSIDPNAYPGPHSGVYSEPSAAALAYPDGSVAPVGYPNTYPAVDQTSDLAAMAASNNELAAMISNMRLEYNSQMHMEMTAFKASVQDDFIALRNQRDAARPEKEALAAQVESTIARLERLEGASKPNTSSSSWQPTATATPRRAKSQPNPPVSKVAKNLPTTPSPAPRAPPSTSQRRTAPHPSGHGETSSKPSSSGNPPPRSTNAKNPTGNGIKNGKQAEPGKRKGEGSSPKTKSSGKATNVRDSPPRKLGEHQMLQTDIDDEAQTFKHFELRFQGLTVTELKRQGIYGRQVIKPSEVKLGVDAIAVIRSNSKVLRAYLKLEENALLHIKSSGLHPKPIFYVQYGNASHYDFFRLNTELINDVNLIIRLYDHYVHHHTYEKWKKEIRTPGGNEIAAIRNKFTQARGRLYSSREKYLNESAVPKRIKLMFSAKATSDDETTPKGSRALARPERSRPADQLVRALETLIVQDLHDDGNARAANATFDERNAGQFHEIPKGMPIQHYDPKWFNNRPPHARAKLEAKRIVAFVPGSTDFFATSGDNALSDQQLTAKYDKQVFADYDLNFGTAKTSKVSDDEQDDADEEGEGDSTYVLCVRYVLDVRPPRRSQDNLPKPSSILPPLARLPCPKPKSSSSLMSPTTTVPFESAHPGPSTTFPLSTHHTIPSYPSGRRPAAAPVSNHNQAKPKTHLNYTLAALAVSPANSSHFDSAEHPSRVPPAPLSPQHLNILKPFSSSSSRRRLKSNQEQSRDGRNFTTRHQQSLLAGPTSFSFRLARNPHAFVTLYHVVLAIVVSELNQNSDGKFLRPTNPALPCLTLQHCTAQVQSSSPPPRVLSYRRA